MTFTLHKKRHSYKSFLALLKKIVLLKNNKVNQKIVINETISRFVMMHQKIVRHAPKIATLLVKQLKNYDTSS